MIQEAISDTFEDLEDEDADEIAQETVDQLLHEITDGKFGTIGTVSNKLPEQEEVLFVAESASTYIYVAASKFVDP